LQLYSTRQASELTGVTVRALRKRIERGQLQAVQHGRFWRIPRSELQRAGLVGTGDLRPVSQAAEVTTAQIEELFAALQRERHARKQLTIELERRRRMIVRLVTELDALRQRRKRSRAQPSRSSLA
jgi:excisionase family DNA binding protein